MVRLRVWSCSSFEVASLPKGTVWCVVTATRWIQPLLARALQPSALSSPSCLSAPLKLLAATHLSTPVVCQYGEAAHPYFSLAPRNRSSTVYLATPDLLVPGATSKGTADLLDWVDKVPSVAAPQ